MSFQLYKGLKKPLVFFGLKDKYIYYALGVIGGGFIVIAILNSTVGFLGILVGAGIIGGGLWWIFKLQDTKGLYNKTKNEDELHIMPKRFKNKTLQKIVNHEKKERI
ncbi:MAG: DUF4133 domain-containing protein [Bergeyella sp.]